MATSFRTQQRPQLKIIDFHEKIKPKLLLCGVGRLVIGNWLLFCPFEFRWILSSIKNVSNFYKSSLEFEIVYIIQSPNYKLYMDIRQKINFKIFERFEEMGISMAFPSRTLYLQKEK